MKKTFALGGFALVIVAVGWFALRREASVSTDLIPTSTIAPASQPPTPPALMQAAMAASARRPSTQPVPETPIRQITTIASPPQTTSRQAIPTSSQMPLAEMLQEGNRFHDPLFGLSVQFPEGWSVTNAIRWGKNNGENTVFFQPPEGSRAVPSMYYQNYPDGAAPAMNDPEALLRDMAQKKEASRVENLPDYKNDPDSFVFRTIDGHPALSYFATYTRPDGEVQAEYFTRVLGPNGYVMFFTRGPVQDVKAIIPAVHQMSDTVRPP